MNLLEASTIMDAVETGLINMEISREQFEIIKDFIGRHLDPAATKAYKENIQGW